LMTSLMISLMISLMTSLTAAARARLSAQSIETATVALTTAPSRHVAAWRSSYEG
jgi:hypothetical protein